MNTQLDRRRITLFLAFAFGISWITAGVIYLTGGLTNSTIVTWIILPSQPGPIPLTLAAILLPTAYMMAPALAHLLTRLITREGRQGLTLWPRLRQGLPYWLAAWFAPGVLTILGGALFFTFLPQHFDTELTFLQGVIPFGIDPWTVVLLQTIQAMLIAPPINALFTFGEEFGWRGYLLPKLLPLGERRAYLISGIIWGLWHAPVIAMGHNYGIFGPDYPGAPWSGILAMIWFTLIVGIFLSWATLRGGSVWPAVIGHAAINGIAALGFIFVIGEPNPLLGPAPTGFLASIPWAALALVLWLRSDPTPSAISRG